MKNKENFLPLFFAGRTNVSLIFNFNFRLELIVEFRKITCQLFISKDILAGVIVNYAKIFPTKAVKVK